MYDIDISLTDHSRIFVKNIIEIKDRPYGLFFTLTANSKVESNCISRQLVNITGSKQIFIPWHMIYMYSVENFQPSGFASKTTFESDEKGKDETLSDALNDLDNRLKEIRGEVKDGLNGLYGSSPKNVFGQTFDEMLKEGTQNDSSN